MIARLGLKNSHSVKPLAASSNGIGEFNAESLCDVNQWLIVEVSATAVMTRPSHLLHAPATGVSRHV